MRRSPLKRKTPLKAKTELKAKTKLETKKPINTVGAVKKRKMPYQMAERRFVMKRDKLCSFPLIQGMSYLPCQNESTEWHHIFMRQNIVGEPWASSRCLTAGVCTLHHMILTENKDLKAKHHMEMLAISRLTRELPIDEITFLAPTFGMRPVGILRHVIEAADKRGWKLPFVTEEIAP